MRLQDDRSRQTWLTEFPTTPPQRSSGVETETRKVSTAEDDGSRRSSANLLQQIMCH